MPDVSRKLTSRWGAVLAVVAFFLMSAAVLATGEAGRESSPTDALPRGADSTIARELQAGLPEQDGTSAVVVFAAERALDTSDFDRLGEIAERLRANVGDSARGPAVIPSEDGTAAITVLALPEAGAEADATTVAAIRAEARVGLPDGVTAQVTGPAGIEADLAAVFDGANFRLLAATASVVAILLIVTYRSPVLWIFPLIVVGLADRVAAVGATHLLKATGTVWDESTIGILSVLVFGAGTDYALLLTSRYRDELRIHADRRSAMAVAVRRTVEAVVASAATVFLGLLCLLFSLFPATRGLGLACAFGVIVAAVFVLVMLPALLVMPGRWVFWPRVPKTEDASPTQARTVWNRVGRTVARRPGRWVVGSLAVLALLSIGVTQLSTGLPQAEQFLVKPEAIAATERLAQSFPAGSADPTTVLTRDDPQRVLRTAEGVPGVESARIAAEADGVAELSVVLAADPSSEAAADTVRALRSALAPLGDTHVGGTEAEALDAAAASARDRGIIFPSLLALVLVALAVLLRSVVAPIILMLTVLLTYVAALGLSWWLFVGPLGFTALDDSTPLYAFVFLVALGVDYNIFLITRAVEEAKGHGTRDGMLRALSATGGVITSAGILLAAVFAVLGVLPLVVLAQIGVVICVGVLLDTLLVRTVLVPAIALVLGEGFWWPRKIGGPSPRRALAGEAADDHPQPRRAHAADA